MSGFSFSRFFLIPPDVVGTGGESRESEIRGPCCHGGCSPAWETETLDKPGNTWRLQAPLSPVKKVAQCSSGRE